MFELVTVRQHPRLLDSVVALDTDAGVLRNQAVLKQGERVLKQWDQVCLHELVPLAAGISQEVGNDAIQPLRFSGHDLQQLLVVIAEFGNSREHADRTRNRGERVADLVRDGGRQPPDSGQPVLHPDLPFQTPDFRQIIEGVHVTEDAAVRDGKGRDHHPESLAKGIGRDEAHLSVGALGAYGRQRIEKQLVHRLPEKFSFRPSQEMLGRAIYQSDMAVEPGGDQTSGDRLNDVFVQRLQVLKGSAGIFQFYVDLPQLRRQQPGKISNRKIGKQVHEDESLERGHLRMSGGIRGHHSEIRQLQDRPVQNEGQRRRQVGPRPGQQDAGDDDHQRIEEVQRAVDAAGDIDQQRNQGEVGQHLDERLDAMLFPEREQEKVKHRDRVPEQYGADKQPDVERGGGDPRNNQLNSQQKCQNDDADLDQPGQPKPLIEHGLHVSTW